MKEYDLAMEIIRKVDEYVEFTHRDETLYHAASWEKRADVIKFIMKTITEQKGGG